MNLISPTEISITRNDLLVLTNCLNGWTGDFFTFDVMSQLVFGTSYHLLTEAANHWIIDGVLGQMRRISFLTTLPELQEMRLHHALFPDARARALRFSAKSREIMEARKIREEKEADSEFSERAKVDLFGKLLSAKDPETGEGLSHKQLWAESNLMIIAGMYRKEAYFILDQ